MSVSASLFAPDPQRRRDMVAAGVDRIRTGDMRRGVLQEGVGLVYMHGVI